MVYLITRLYAYKNWFDEFPLYCVSSIDSIEDFMANQTQRLINCKYKMKSQREIGIELVLGSQKALRKVCTTIRWLMSLKIYVLFGE